MTAFTIATPRYFIESVKGDHFDVFNQRTNAIRCAIKMATEYPGTTFVVVKKANYKRKIIFQFKIDIQMDFDDLTDVYQAVIDSYQKKLDKTKFWRKLDEPGT